MVETVPSEQERTWAAAAHLTVLLDIISAPVFGLVGAIVVYVLSRDRGAFARDQAREALNFQLTFALVLVAVGVAALIQVTNGSHGVVHWHTTVLLYFAVMFCAFVAALITGVVGAVRAKDGRAFRYPVAIRFLR